MSYPKLTADDIETMSLFFDWVDSDRDGYITIAEIKTACGVDIDGDGFVSEEEKTACAQAWIAALAQQDADADQKLTLEELLKYNNDSKQ
jgi:Ca2+-binding EF-hand superfamily protein